MDQGFLKMNKLDDDPQNFVVSTIEDVDNTKRLIVEIKALAVTLHVFSPFNSPFSKTANEAVDKLRELEKIWKI